MRDGGIASFSLATNNFNNLPDPKKPIMRDLYNALGQTVNLNQRQMMRGVFALEGALGSDWSWEVYTQHSQVRERQHVENNNIAANYNAAADVVSGDRHRLQFAGRRQHDPGRPGNDSVERRGRAGRRCAVRQHAEIPCHPARQLCRGPRELTARSRIIGTAQLATFQRDSGNNRIYWRSGVQVDDNSIPAVAHLDLRASFKWSDKITIYGAIDNMLNTPPPNIASTSGGSASNLTIYDGMGRNFRIGVRFLDWRPALFRT